MRSRRSIGRVDSTEIQTSCCMNGYQSPSTGKELTRGLSEMQCVTIDGHQSTPSQYSVANDGLSLAQANRTPEASSTLSPIQSTPEASSTLFRARRGRGSR
jgi:hypothetical protein